MDPKDNFLNFQLLKADIKNGCFMNANCQLLIDEKRHKKIKSKYSKEAKIIINNFDKYEIINEHSIDNY